MLWFWHDFAGECVTVPLAPCNQVMQGRIFFCCWQLSTNNRVNPGQEGRVVFWGHSFEPQQTMGMRRASPLEFYAVEIVHHLRSQRIRLFVSKKLQHCLQP